MKETPLQIIVTGASGRMGSLIAATIINSPDFELAGATETKDRLDLISSLPCTVSSSLEDLLSAFPEAVTIDFTRAEASLEHARTAVKKNAPIVIGSTGFTANDRAELENLAKKTRIFWSANMSVGINALLKILPELARKLGDDYDMEIMELHHKHKKDSPSGTALMLAEELAKAKGWELEKVRNSARDGIIGERPQKEIGVQVLRGGDVVGIHSIWFLGPGETIEITHQAQSRENFVNGALRAAKWLISQKSGKVYSMQDVIAQTGIGS